MSAADRAAELRALADHYDTIGDLETKHAEATDAYRADKTDTTRAAYEDASRALRDAREEARSSGVMAASNEPGSVTLQPAAAGSTRKKG